MKLGKIIKLMIKIQLNPTPFLIQLVHKYPYRVLTDLHPHNIY